MKTKTIAMQNSLHLPDFVAHYDDQLRSVTFHGAEVMDMLTADEIAKIERMIEI